MLRARILLFQTPGSFRPNKLSDAEEFLGKVKRDDLVVGWETRGPAWDNPEVRENLAESLKASDVVHVTDPFKALPVYTENVVYFRLHGLGKQLYYYQYKNDELKQLRRIVQSFERDGKDVYVMFDNLAMFDDAKRFMHSVKTGSFPSLTDAVGINSVRGVIERTRYPVTKSVLFERLGWKLMELEKGKQTRLDELLKPLTSKYFRSVDEVLQEIEKTR